MDFDNIPKDMNAFTYYGLFTLICVLFIVWIVYATFFHSRVIGYILTKFINLMLISKKENFKIGSIAISFLPGKLMLRDVQYTTKDYSIYINDGFIIFRWWIPLNETINLHESYSIHRIFCSLNGVQLFCYNHSSIYAKLALALECMLNKTDPHQIPEIFPKQKASTSISDFTFWLTFFPVMKFQINQARLVIGNQTLPNVLAIEMDESKFYYFVRPAMSDASADLFCEKIKGKASDLKIALVKNDRYTKNNYECLVPNRPPISMDHKYNIAICPRLEFEYCQDKPGLLTTQNESTYPCWTCNATLSKTSTISYGPWADKNREYLYSFFFPTFYEDLTPVAQPGTSIRIHKSFKLTINTEERTNVNVVFAKFKSTQTLNLVINEPSTINISVPFTRDLYRIEQPEFKFDSDIPPGQKNSAELTVTNTLTTRFTFIEATLNGFDVNTSMMFKPFLRSKVLKLKLDINYKHYFNELQVWYFDINLNDPLVYGLYNHKDLITHLIDDWGNKEQRPDALTFVPFVWKFNLIADNLHLITFTNPYNYVDCSNAGYNSQNCMTALQMQNLAGNFALNFDTFAPKMNAINFDFNAQRVALSCIIPDYVAGKAYLLLVQKESRYSSNGMFLNYMSSHESTGRLLDDGFDKRMWLTCWEIQENMHFHINYSYYPEYPSSQSYVHNSIKPLPAKKVQSTNVDSMTISVNLDPSNVYANGALLIHLLHFKENYFGEFQCFTPSPDEEHSVTVLDMPSLNSENGESAQNLFSPLDIRVFVSLQYPKVILQKACSSQLDEYCPAVTFQQITFLMIKTSEETIMKLDASPATFKLSNKAKIDVGNTSEPALERPIEDKVEKEEERESVLEIDGIQFKARALFSRRDLSLLQESLEYAWIIHFNMGNINGDITTTHILQMTEFVNMLTLSIKAYNNDCIHPKIIKLSRGYKVFEQPGSVKGTSVARTSKFKPDQSTRSTNQKLNLLRDKTGSSLSVILQPSYTLETFKFCPITMHFGTIDLTIWNDQHSLNVHVSHIAFGTCNLIDYYSNKTMGYLTLGTSSLELRTPSMKGDDDKQSGDEGVYVLNCGYVKIPTITIDIASDPVTASPLSLAQGAAKTTTVSPSSIQKHFLTFHDGATKRLPFLYVHTSTTRFRGSRERHADCGCYALARCTKSEPDHTTTHFFDADHFEQPLQNFYRDTLNTLSLSFDSYPLPPDDLLDHVSPITTKDLGMPGSGESKEFPHQNASDVVTSDSLDNASFRSAKSSVSDTSQGDKYGKPFKGREEMSSPQWVILTGQMNRSIDKSPLFMSSYAHYLQVDRFDKGTRRGGHIYRKGINTTQIVSYTVSSNSLLTRPDSMYGNSSQKTEKGSQKFPTRNSKPSELENQELESKPSLIKVRVKCFIEIQLTPLAIDILKSLIDSTNDSIGKYVGKMHCLNVLQNVHASILTQLSNSTTALTSCPYPRSFVSIEIQGVKLNFLQVCLIKERVTIDQLDELSEIATCTTLFIAFINKIKVQAFSSTHLRSWEAGKKTAKFIVRTQIDSVGLQLRRFENAQKNMSGTSINENGNRAVISEKNSKLKFRMLPLILNQQKMNEKNNIDIFLGAHPLLDSTGFIIFEACIEGINAKSDHLDHHFLLNDFHPILQCSENGETALPEFSTIESGLSIDDIWLNFPASFYFDQNKELTNAQDDWHIFTTTSASITAWVNPTYRLVKFMQIYKEAMHSECLFLINFLLMQTKDTSLNGIFPKSATFPSQSAENSILLNTNASLTFFQEAYSYLIEAPVKSHYKSSFEKAYWRFKRSALVKQSLKTLFNANLHLWYRERYKQWHEILFNMRSNSVFLDTALGSRQELNNINSIESQEYRSSTSSLNKSSETLNLKNNILRRMSRAILSPSKSKITSNKKRSASFADKYMRVPITKRDSTLIFKGNRRTPGFLDRRSLWVVSLIRSKNSYGYMKGQKLTSGQLALPPSFTHVRTPIIPLKNYESDATKSKSKQSTLLTKSPIMEVESAYNIYQYETVMYILNHWESLENIDLNVGNDLNPVVANKVATDEVVRIQWCHTAMRHLLQHCADARTMFHRKAVLKKYELLFNLGSIKINIIECYNAPPPSAHLLPTSSSTTAPSSNQTTTNQQSSITDAYTNLALRRKRNTLFSINRHFSLQPMNVMDHNTGKNVHHSTLADIEAPNITGDAPNKNISSDRYYYYTMPSSADPKLFAFTNICARLNYLETFKIPKVRPQFDALIQAASPNDSDNMSSVRDHLKLIQLPIIIYDFNVEGKYLCLPKLRIITNVSSFSHHINTSTLKLIYQIIWIMKNFYVVKSELEDKRNLYNLGEGGETAYGSSTYEAGNNDNYSKASKRRFGSKKQRSRGKILTAPQGLRENDSSSNSTSLSSFSMMDRELLDNVEESECGNTFIENLSPNDRASSNLCEDFGLSPLPSSSSSNLTASSPDSSTSNSPSSHSKTSSDPSDLSIDVDELPDGSGKSFGSFFHLPIITESSIRDIMATFYTDLGIRKNFGAKGLRLAKFKNDITSLIERLGEDGDETICVIECASTSVLSLWQGIKDDTSLKRIIDLVDVQEDNQDLDNARDFDADIWGCHNLAIESSCHISYIRLWFGVEGLNLQFELLNLLLNYDAPSIGHEKYQYNANGDIFALSKSVFMNCPQMSITLMESYSSLSNLLLNFNIVDTLMFYNLAKHSVPPVSGNLLNLTDERTKDSILLKFGDVKLEIPQHPIVLHEIFTRITTKLTETLNQFAFYFHQNKGESDKGMPENPSSVYRSNSILTEKGNADCSNKSSAIKMENKNKSPMDNYEYPNKIAFDNFTASNVEADQHIIVNIYWKEINFEAALLPSLKALYNLKDVHMYGVKREKIDISLNFTNHALILRSMILDPLLKLSPETHIVLPFVSIKAHYIWNLYGALQMQFYQAITQNNIKALVKADLEIGYFERSLTTDLLNNLVFIQKVFMKEVNELLQRLTGMEQPQIPKFIESKRQSITQEVVEPKATNPTSYLYMIHLKLKGLQLTASTPTNIALRFETSAIDFKLFNQIVQSHRESSKLNNDRNEHTQSPNSHFEEKVLKRSSTKINKSLHQRTFVLKTLATFKFKISVSLGQMTQNQLYEEAESEYNPLAHFTTTISMKNTPKKSRDCDRSKGLEDGTEVIMVGVQRPHLNVQALAVDKAILIYINYKTAYEYWNEQRAALKRDVQVATQQVMEKLTTPIPQQTPKTFTQLFLQLTIDNLGISLPLQKPPNILLASTINSDPDNYSNAMGNESDHSAFFPADDPTIYMVLTIEHSRIFAFSKDVFVCKGVFSDLCIRFSSDFDPSYDDWSPNTRIISQDKITSARIFCNSASNTLNYYNSTLLDSLVCNSCHVKEGTYEVCSNTFSTSTFNPKWVLNINWNMRGVDFLANTYIGICLKNLIYTLTILTKEELDGEEISMSTTIATKTKSQTSTPKPKAVNNNFGDNMKTKTSEPKTPSPINQNLPKVYYEAMGKLGDIPLTFLKEYHDQARNLHLLKQLGADDEKIRMETGKLLNMESQVAVDYRHDIFRKLNKQSIKAALIKQPLLEDGTSQRPKSLLSSHQRQNSIACTNEFGTKSLRHHKSSSFGGQVDAADILKEKDEYDTNLTDSTSRNAQGQLDDIMPSYKQSLDRQTRKGVEDNEYVYSPLHPSQSHPIALCNAGGQSGEQPLMEESKIDFDLDVKVNIESGTFILFNDTKDMDAFKDLLCKEKTFFKTSSELCIPNVGNRSHMVFDGGYTSPLGYKNQSQQTQYPTVGTKTTKLDPNVKHDIITSGSYFNFPSQRQSLSILYDKIKNFINIGALKYSSSISLPGLDVKVKYSSHNITANLQHIHDKTPKASNDSRRNTQFLDRKNKVRRVHRSFVPLEDLNTNKVLNNKNVHVDPCAKSADLYIWVTIRTFIKENKLDPHILEFIEAVLEPLPMSDMTKKPPSTNETSTSEADKRKEKAKLSTTDANVVYVATTNFPVNVFVYLRVNPSSFRFSCLPVSRVECIIYLPSLDLIFTSKTLDNHPASQDFFQSHIPKRGDTVEMPLYLMKEYARAGSGISVILFLSKFSLEIFHPYGGITTKNPASTTFSSNHLNRDSSTSNSYNAENGDINGSGINVDKNKARKKFLSLDIDYIQINVMRKRTLADSLEKKGKISSKATSLGCNIDESQRLTIYLSGLCDFGSASFKYDMRRLNEILVFPRAWYRKSIAKRILLGEHDHKDTVIIPISLTPVSASKCKASRTNPQAPPNAADVVKQQMKAHTINTATLDHKVVRRGRRKGASDGASSTLPPSTKINLDSVQFSVDDSSSSTSSSLTNELHSVDEEQKSDLASNASSSFQSLRSSDNTLDSAIYKQGLNNNESKREKNMDLPPSALPKSPLKWESLLILAIRFEKVAIQMNMGNVMGNVNWNSQGWESHSRVYIDSEHHKNVLMTFGLSESFLDAKSGIVGGDLEMKQFFQTFRLLTNPHLVQVRIADAMLHVLQVRLDYMGSTILIARISQINSSIKDDWDIISQCANDSEKERLISAKNLHPRDLLFSRVRLHTTLKWDHFQLLICQSTQSDMQKMCMKIVEFFQHQFQSSVAMLPNLKKSLKPPNAADAAQDKTKKADFKNCLGTQNSNCLPDVQRHYAFWLKIRKLVQLVTSYDDIKAKLVSAIKSRIAIILKKQLSGQEGHIQPLVLGGSFVFQGNHLSLACFYGINFRAKTWAIFSMREISVVFSSQNNGLNFLRLILRDFEEAQKSSKLIKELIQTENICPLTLNQNLLFQLGFPIEGEMMENVKKSKKEMAIILKITRSHYIPPKSSTIQEWCFYAFCKSSIDEVESFPAIEDRKPVVVKDVRNVTAETIFSLPRLQINMKSEHSTSTYSNDHDFSVPHEITVKYDFLSEFEDHILVSVDAEVLAFLHDLVISYTNKNYATQEKVVARKASMSNTDIKSINQHSDIEDDRNFVCNTWRLEPTLRIMSWKGQHLEAYGVDYILHKLGFTHARLTIPKWIQRGSMDPLDKFISFTLYYVLVKSGKFGEFKLH